MCFAADDADSTAIVRNQHSAVDMVLTRFNELEQSGLTSRSLDTTCSHIGAGFQQLEDIKDLAIKHKKEWTERYGAAGTQLSEQCVELQQSTRHLSSSSKRRRLEGGFSREMTVACEHGGASC